MKTLAAFTLLLILVSGVAFSEWRSNARNEQQLLDYERHVQQLLSDIENNSLRRLDAEKQIDQLGRDLTELRSQLSSMGNQLQTAQQQVNPEYEVMEQRIRRELRRELQEQQAAAASPKTSLIRQLSQLDPVELGELMSLQGRYGGFLQALNVDDARLDEIVDGLSNMIAEQNQARMELFNNMQDQNTNPREFRRQMLTVETPEAHTEALSFFLTEDEMALFNEYQASQPQPAFTRGVFRSGGRINSADNATFIEAPPGAPPGIINLEVITAEPQ